MASSSSSHPKNEGRHVLSEIVPQHTWRKASESPRLFDVFINHRGPDVKKTVALQLYNSLRGLGVNAFLDSKEKKLCDSFPSTIENAIYSASAHIAIFSNRYAESPWCLAELVLMLQSRAKIFPLFYGVKPSDLRYIENGKYAKAFTRYERKKRYMEKLTEWKEALRSVSLITGHEISGYFNISDCQDIVSAVQKEVERTKFLHVAKYPVGLDKLVKEFERLCLDKVVEDFERQCQMNETGKDKVQVVGIFGMGGMGKTSLAKELFNRKRSEYTQACFLFDVREAYADNSFPALQTKFLKDLCQQDNLNIHCIEDGTSHIERCIKRSQQLSFLVVLDDIDQVQQLDSLLIIDMLKKSDQNMKSTRSLVIATTRDVGVLINAGITTTYNVKGMDRDDARELFCWHAFGQQQPAKDYRMVLESFLNVCGGLPLSLEVIGSHVRGRDKNYWKLELDKVSKALPPDIHQRIKISFDALDYQENQIFIDIACFFIGKLKSVAMGVWEASGCSAQHALETLKDKCLVQEIEEIPLWAKSGEKRSVLRMHDCLWDLGREIANGLTRPPRLWCAEDLEHLESKGFRDILAQTKGRCFHSFIDKSMNCRITYFLGGSDTRDDTTNFLFWLQLEYYGFRNRRSIPSWIPFHNLRCLIIRNMWVKTLWQSHAQEPTQLEDLQIGDTALDECLDLSGMPNSLEIKKYDLKKLTELNISMCQDLQELGVGHLNCLEKLILHNCCSLKTLTGMTDLGLLVELNISRCPGIEQLRLAGLDSFNCFSVDHFLKPKHFELDNCTKLKTIPENLNLEKLVSISIRNCTELEVFPSLEGLRNLETVTIDGCGKLKSLLFSQCHNLEIVTARLDTTCLAMIVIHGCGKLNRFQLSKCHNLKQVSVSDCPELDELPCFVHQNCLETITVVRCGKLQNITLPPQLVELRIEECKELETVTARLDPTCLQKIVIHGCGKLNCFQLSKCHNLRPVSVSDCPELDELPCFVHQTCLETISVVRCGKLQNIILPPQLVELRIEECKELETVVVICHGCDRLEREQEPRSPRQNYPATIVIVRCEKLQSITLPTEVVELRIEMCRELKAVAVTLHRRECPERKELSSDVPLSCLKQIIIHTCGKLQSIQGIDELLSIESMQILFCSNASIRDWIPMLKGMPSKFLLLVGRAVHGALSNLNLALDFDFEIFTKDCSSLRDVMENLGEWNALIICAEVSSIARVGVNNLEDNWKWNLDPEPDSELPSHSDPNHANISSSLTNWFLPGVNNLEDTWKWNLDPKPDSELPSHSDPNHANISSSLTNCFLPGGKWTITIVITNAMQMRRKHEHRIKEFLGGLPWTFKPMKLVGVQRAAQWEIQHVLNKIVDRIYYKQGLRAARVPG